MKNRATGLVLLVLMSLPALAQLRAALTFAAIGRRKRIGLVGAMTDDIEWNGEPEIEN